MKIELKQNNIVRVAKEKIITDSEFELEIISDYDLSTAVIFLKNGETEKKYDYARHIKLPRELVKAGRLYITCELYDGAKLLKRWNVEPIILIEKQGVFELEPWCAKIEKEIAELQAAQKIIL